MSITSTSRRRKSRPREDVEMLLISLCWKGPQKFYNMGLGPYHHYCYSCSH